MIARLVVMSHELINRTTQRRLSEEDHPCQAFFLDCANGPLSVCIQVRRHRRQPDDHDSNIFYFAVRIREEKPSMLIQKLLLSLLVFPCAVIAREPAPAYPTKPYCPLMQSTLLTPRCGGRS